MLKHLGIVVFMFGAACSKGDKCEKAYDKIAPLMKAMEKDAEKDDKRDDKDDRTKMVGKCKADLKDHPDREKVLDCFLAVSGELTMEKLEACSKEEKAERKKDKEENGGSGAGGGAKVAEMMAKMTEFKDQMCACTDPACAAKISEAMTKWNQDMGKDMSTMKMSEEDNKKVTEIAAKMGECTQKAMAPAAK